LNNLQRSSRIDIIDALRGFSLAGIVIVHMVENYVGAPVPEGAMEAAHQGVMDYVVDGFILLFLRGKFFALFSFLFGLSFFIQMRNASLKGMSFRLRFIWRLTILLCIGYLHSLFYRGDILTVYASLGIFLIPFYKLKKHWVYVVAILLFLGLGRYVVFIFNNGNNLFMEGAFNPNSPDITAYYNVLLNGSIWDVFKTNAWAGHLMKMDFQLGIFSRGYLTFGFFLMGLYAGRLDFFNTYLTEKKLISRVLWGAIALFVISLLITFGSFSQLGEQPAFDNWYAMIGLTGFDLNNVGMTFIIICLFVKVYSSDRWNHGLKIFMPYGRMALTNYVLQSVIGTFVFYGWGLAYLGKLSNTVSFVLALLIILLQMLFSKWWMKRFYYGPFEWIWRSLTFLKVFPFKRGQEIENRSSS